MSSSISDDFERCDTRQPCDANPTELSRFQLQVRLGAMLSDEKRLADGEQQGEDNQEMRRDAQQELEPQEQDSTERREPLAMGSLDDVTPFEANEEENSNWAVSAGQEIANSSSNNNNNNNNNIENNTTNKRRKQRNPRKQSGGVESVSSSSSSPRSSQGCLQEEEEDDDEDDEDEQHDERRAQEAAAAEAPATSTGKGKQRKLTRAYKVC